MAAALGFQLLVPLQVTAAWRFHRPATLAQEQQASQSGRKLADLRQAIGSAPTPQVLQARLQKLLGPNAGLSPVELRIAISALPHALGFTFLAGMLPPVQAAGVSRGLDEECIKKPVR